MTMAREDLARMVGQITAYFEAYGEVEAIDGVRSHLLRFWDPAMRHQIKADLLDGRITLNGIADAAVRGLPDDR